MKRRRRVWYFVTCAETTYWWQRNKWVLAPAERASCSSHAYMPTLRKAKRCALRCPAEMVILKFFIKHGKRYVREYRLGELKEVENDKL